MTTNKQDLGLTRNPIDKYYTKSDVVDTCIQLINKNLKINSEDLIIEPSAGNGAFIDGIKTLGGEYKFYDLEPEHTEIIKQDYLEFNYITDNKYKNIHLIGNPPFGRQSSLAIKFIKKSCEYCDSISFILPKSFKKDSMKNRFHLKFHLILEFDIPKNAFLVDNKEHDVPCVFQIWEKRKESRTVIEKLIPNKYSFVKKDEEPDIAFRRVGVNAGNIDKNIDDKSIQSHYFIKFEDLLTDELYEKFSKLNFSCSSNTVGPKSISKQELIKEFNVV